jgi:hypothetical protein
MGKDNFRVIYYLQTSCGEGLKTGECYRMQVNDTSAKFSTGKCQ